MTLDEVIIQEEASNNEWLLKSEQYKLERDYSQSCKQYADYHKQIAEWLKELKELRSMVKSTAFKDGYEQGINFACGVLSEFISCKHCPCVCNKTNLYCGRCNAILANYVNCELEAEIAKGESE